MDATETDSVGEPDQTTFVHISPLAMGNTNIS